uniref:Uncharacterized protein n=1 Tax=Ralstonia solanacearum TaxID=305 RepID=A0A0S4WT17_RALSL|nr:conserved protein of unknown function [Ralstonia solanacearum]CUV54557.1 conserved protein of unknown function [Ralstonia solanacearum]
MRSAQSYAPGDAHALANDVSRVAYRANRMLIRRLPPSNRQAVEDGYQIVSAPASAATRGRQRPAPGARLTGSGQRPAPPNASGLRLAHATARHSAPADRVPMVTPPQKRMARSAMTSTPSATARLTPSHYDLLVYRNRERIS